MALIVRWLLAAVACFLIFPVAFVLWKGPDNQFGYAGGMFLMLFLQFSSPYSFWKIPLAIGTALGLGWHIAACLRLSERGSMPPVI